METVKHNIEASAQVLAEHNKLRAYCLDIAACIACVVAVANYEPSSHTDMRSETEMFNALLQQSGLRVTTVHPTAIDNYDALAMSDDEGHRVGFVVMHDGTYNFTSEKDGQTYPCPSRDEVVSIATKLQEVQE